MNEGADIVSVKILRYDPKDGGKSRVQEYLVPREDKIRVLDFLKYIYEELDPSLSYRRHLCDVRLCLGCLMRVNHRNCLVCWEKVDKNEKEILIEPASGYPVLKDLVVDFAAKEASEKD